MRLKGKAKKFGIWTILIPAILLFVGVPLVGYCLWLRDPHFLAFLFEGKGFFIYLCVAVIVLTVAPLMYSAKIK